MTAQIAASVIVATHRGAHRLPALLEALSLQDVDERWELVVVLDGVLDDTPELLDRWRDRLPLRVIVLEQQLGVTAALDQGYAAAAGAVLIRCDDDLTPRADFVRRHVAWHEERHTYGVISVTRDVFPPTPYALAYGIVANDRARRAAYAQAPERRWVHWAACNSVHRTTWERVGGFDHRFVYGQDSELGWRLREAGTEIVIDPALEIEHRGPTTETATRAARAFVSGASRLLFAEVHGEHERTAAEPTWSPKAMLWSTGVRLLASTLTTREACHRRGALVDRLLPWLPLVVGRAAVAALVEASGAAGERRGTADLGTYRSQKQAEADLELRRTPRP